MLPSGLTEAARDRRLVVFVGAGVSTSLGLPTFRELVEIMAEDLGYDPAIFQLLGDTYPELAEYYEISQGGLGGLRSQMDAKWHDSSIDLGDSVVHRLLPELGARRIYTTNYDRWIERSFERLGRPFKAIVRVDDVLGAREEETQIVKFHGDFSSDDSLVLTERSYFERLELDGPLDILLRSDVLTNSVLFLGYSLTDLNLRFLLFKLSEIWRGAATPAERPRSFVVLARPNPVQKAVLTRRGVDSVVLDEGDTTAQLTSLLADLAFEATGFEFDSSAPW